MFVKMLLRQGHVCRSAVHIGVWSGRRNHVATLSDPLAAADDAAHNIFRVKLRPLQRAAVAAAVRGDSFLFVSPTGSGKSVCFQLPAAIQPAGLTTLVVSPLRALMEEQVVALRRLGIDAVELHSGSSASTLLERVAAATAPPRLIYTTPEWLVRHYMQLTEDARVRVGRMVVDEAHCLSEWGAASGFRSDYLQLGKIRSYLAAHTGLTSLPVSCFTATAAEQVRQDIIQHLDLPPLSDAPVPNLSGMLQPHSHPQQQPRLEIDTGGSVLNATLLIEANPDRPNLELNVRAAPSDLAVGGRLNESERTLIEHLAHEVIADGKEPCTVSSSRVLSRTIVFCTTRADADRIAVGLARLLPLMAAGSDVADEIGYRRRSSGEATVDVYHSGLSAAARRKSARQWARGLTRVLVATPAFGLGLDSPDVRLILHPMMPPSLASYWQQVGRAGRDGRKARCILWYSPGDVGRVRHCLQAANPGLMSLPRAQAELSAMEAFCTAKGCRREILFKHLGSDLEDDHEPSAARRCGNCDNCMPLSNNGSTPDLEIESAVSAALAEVDMAAISERRKRDQARAVRRRSRDNARARRKQLASAAAAAAARHR